ncbi:hypothetical protein NAT51_13710 [Flavobacterium amniphilum]|uniref:hypothetical protein n=1 Tax=Flavobacterium amniphilum TaxID=1834035 RepID=UPI002029FEFB|nr:hypothetical protein [Flavobacterium amniphilum]MCL9806587.1 hypothetical protein [Flavobacterium amniphilum]
MKKIKTSSLFLILSSILFISCKNDNNKLKSEVIPQKEDLEKAVDNPESKNLSLLYSEDSDNGSGSIQISASESHENDKYFLTGNKNFIIASILKKMDGSMKLIQQDTLLSDEFQYVHVDAKNFVKKTINNRNNLLMSVLETPMGNGDPERYVTFFMIDLKNLKSYSLQYKGEESLRCDECIDGEFIKNKTLESNPEIKDVLYQYANTSKWIYTPKGKEKDLSHYKNYVQKWNADNNTENNLANGNSPLPDVLYSTYYKENLFEFTGDYSENEAIENNNYIIVSYFRNSIIAYDKNKKLYFPVFVESCATGCNKEIKFVSENTIEIRYTEYSGHKGEIIDLNAIKFKN